MAPRRGIPISRVRAGRGVTWRAWLYRWLHAQVAKIAPFRGNPEQCDVCGWYTTYHNPDCDTLLANLTGEQWQARAFKLRAERDAANARTVKAWNEARLWQGKYHTLRLENNALRKQIRRTPDSERNLATPGGD